MTTKIMKSTNQPDAPDLSMSGGYTPHAGDRFKKAAYYYECPITGLSVTTASHDLTVTSVGADKVKYICDDKDEQSEDLSVFIKLAENTLKNGAKLTNELRQLTGYELYR